MTTEVDRLVHLSGIEVHLRVMTITYQQTVYLLIGECEMNVKEYGSELSMEWHTRLLLSVTDSDMSSCHLTCNDI